MAERDESQPDEMQLSLGGVAAGIDVGELEQARAGVDDVIGRRRSRKRVGALVGAAAVVAVAATTVVLSFGGDGPDTLVTSDDTAPANTTPDETEEVPEPTLALAVAAAQPVELIDVTARPGAAAGTNGAPEFGEWIVPWEDGFLVGSTAFPPQLLPDELPEDVRALFPQEVIDFFDGELPDTIAEATEQLAEAGLLEAVSDVIQKNQAASDAIYGVPTDPPTLDVRFTVDGVTWEPREMVLPPGASYLSSVTAVDGRLAAVFGNDGPVSGPTVDGTVTVANTSDLTNWATQEIVLPSPGELPNGINWNVSPQGLVANADGWVVQVYDSIDADPYSLLPAEVQAEIESDDSGFGVESDDRGITIEYGFGPLGGNPSETRTFTWDELGVSPEVAALFDQQGFEPTLWASTWDGVPVAADGPAMGGPMAATASGFLMWTDQSWFSPDGVTWEAGPLPDDAIWMTGSFNVEGGLVVMSSTDSGSALVHRVDERGQNAVLLDLPVPTDGSLSGGGPPTSSYTSGILLFLQPAFTPEQQITVEADGYRLAFPQQTSIFEVVDVATGEVIASGNPFLPGNEDSAIQVDENGVTITDEATGDVLVVFPNELLEAAQNESMQGDGGEYDPDFWLIASLDGERFLVEDIADMTEGPTSLATNGIRLLLQSGTDWMVFDLA